jgi:Methyltransferase domain
LGFTRVIAKLITNYDDTTSIASRIRRRRIGPLVRLIEAVHAKYGYVKVIDIGGTRRYWEILPKEVLISKKVLITIVNLPGSRVSQDDTHFEFIEDDGCNLSQYENNSFHIVHSNSVIEHVGDWNRMVSFASEVRRLAPNYFVQTPYFWFPLEPHCMTPIFHWLPKPIRVGLVLRFGLGHWKRCITVDEAVRQVEDARLLDKRMFRYLFPDADHITENFFFLPKSLIAVRADGI